MSTASGTSTESPIINPSALEPLFEPWEEPIAHRVRSDKPDTRSEIRKGRRPSNIVIAQNLRSKVKEWRETFYAGASDTTRQLFSYWFERPHRMKTPDGDEFEFRYYFCQREAIETFVYLKELRQIECLSQLVAEFGGPQAEIAALGIHEDEDAWSRYAFKLATGAGKTKVMSLAMTWSYFHSLRESESPMARHFVVIAPNLTVYERLKEDFGDERIFHSDHADPLIPPEWVGDWNMSVILQDEASGATTGGTIYLTNIHRLYDPAKRKNSKNAETYAWMGPPVSKAKALDTGETLRQRITSHKRIMVLNDEAHHIWEPDSAWNEALRYLHDTMMARSGGQIVAQLDFSATPKDNKAQYFKHIICDTPLGEAVDAGIVKTPIIGRADKKLSEEASDNAAYRFDRHIRLGYARWLKSKAEWEKSGKKALLFVMCEDTEAADQIARRLNTDEAFKDLNGKTINLHTNLKGKLKKIGKGANARYEFVENEKEISDEDLKALRKLSRDLDKNSSPYRCIVSVLMLREGWDVRNVTTIVPLRPYSSKANILPEQTLGRGLRRMTPPGSQGAHELVTVVDHPAFASLYQHELAQEGLPLEIVDVDSIPATTVTIFPDESRKRFDDLEIAVPNLTPAHRILPKLEGLSIDDIKNEFKKYKPLPLGKKGTEEIEYEGRHLFTGEVIEKMKIYLPLLESGVGAISYYVKQLESICKLSSLHTSLAPLLQEFLEEILFDKKTNLFDPALASRLADSDVAEHIRAIFVPLIRKRTTTIEQRLPGAEPMRLSQWKPFQVTHSERRPVLEADRTLFNLAPCNRELEVAVTKFLDTASDVAAFAKNAGPQCLRIDYLTAHGRLAFYTPDFFARTLNGNYYLVETKGREDVDVPRKARAAVAWCKSASTKNCKWEYVYVPQGVFGRMTGNSFEELVRTCRPALENVLQSEQIEERFPLFAGVLEPEEERPELRDIVDEDTLKALPSRYQKAVEQAAMLFRFLENKQGINFASVFNPLLGSLDEAAKGLILRKLQSDLPPTVAEQKAWFSPYLEDIDQPLHNHLEKMAYNLKRTLVFNTGLSPVGLLRSCLEYAIKEKTQLGGVFAAVKSHFAFANASALLTQVADINDFRNMYVAHQAKELTDSQLAKTHLGKWIGCLRSIVETG